MSTYEKIASVIIGILIVVMIIFSFHEITEPKEHIGEAKQGSDFDDSIGQNFKIGPFTSIVGEVISGGVENNCEPLKPVIVGALHDIAVRLKAQMSPTTSYSSQFEVNEATLQDLCNKNTEITLADAQGDRLILQKIPFTRGLPPQSTEADIGTEVRINATLVSAGKPIPTQPTTYGDLLIPDRFLDTATSSSF